ncbi:MAG TPA: hypothetical protein VM534_07165 [Thermoanaerobaculia bacterium]|nr:hypothetical protein [Thermoanaerobaculia bacterium]
MGIDAEIERELRSLVDDYRDRCLWFLRRDYYPQTPEEIARVLDSIRRHGDVEALRRAGRIEQWLSRVISETSAGS